MTESKNKTWIVMNAITAMIMLLTVTGVAKAQQDDLPENKPYRQPMETDPQLEGSKSYRTFDKRLAPMWLQALQQTDDKIQAQTAATIAKAASMGMTGLEDTLPVLRTLASSSNVHRMTRLEAMKALVALDDKTQAEVFWNISLQLDHDMIKIIDPALAHWQYAPAIEGWRTRVSDLAVTKFARLSAIEALTIAKDAQASPILLKLAQDTSLPPNIRVAAAQGYLAISPAHGQSLDIKIDQSTPLIDRLVAAWLLKDIQNNQIRSHLLALAQDNVPAIAVVAAQKLLDAQSTELDLLLRKYDTSEDVKLRTVALERHFQRREQADFRALGRFLSDPDPQLRIWSRNRLITLADVEGLRPGVVQVLMAELASDNVLAQEQAALAIGGVDVKEAADRLVELLATDTPAVLTATGLALRMIMVESTQAAALDFVTKNSLVGARPHASIAAANLAQMLGRLGYRPAEELFLGLVNKSDRPGNVRAAAIWSLGLFNEGKPDSSLISRLTSRANDSVGMFPEDGQVRMQSVTAIGRMGDSGSLANLQRWSREPDDPLVSAAARWSIGRITGQRPPEPAPYPAEVRNWFLEPIY